MGAINRLLACASAHMAVTPIDASHTTACVDPIANFTRTICAGRPLMATIMAQGVSQAHLQYTQRLLEVATRLVRTPNGPAPCFNTLPTKRMTTDGKLLTTQCPQASTEPGPHCVGGPNPQPYVVVNGVAYYQLYNAPGYQAVQPTGCSYAYPYYNN